MTRSIRHACRNAIPGILSVVLGFSATSAFSAPKYGKNVTPLAEDSTYVRMSAKTDFWKLIPYYVPQHNEKACGVASSIMVLNALFADERKTADDKNIGVAEIQKLAPKFKKNTSKNGKGFKLDELAETLTTLLEAHAEGAYTVTVERFDAKDSKAEMKRLEKLLTKNDRNPKDFIIANFLQGILTGDKSGLVGHIAPVGSYDPKKKRVLILDPDREYYTPYWVPLAKFFDGMNTSDPASSKKRGLIRIEKNGG